MPAPTPEALFVAFRTHGDADALAAVFDQLAPKLLLVAAHLAGGAVAEDVVQATFLDALRQRERWDAARPLVPWLLGLLGNHVREARRQRRRVPDERRLPVRTVDAPPDEAAASECFAAVAAAVDALPRHYRQVLSLRLVHGLELQQIAHSLDVPLGTVKVRVHRGLALLRRALPAGLATALAAVLTPSLGLAAMRDGVLAAAGCAVAGAGAAGAPAAGTTGSAANVGTTGTAGGAAPIAGAAAATAFMFGGLGMKKLVLGAVGAVVVAGAWIALDPLAGSVRAPGAGDAAAAIARVAPSVEERANAALADGTAVRVDDASPTRAAVATTGSVAVELVWASDGAPAAGVTVQAWLAGEREHTRRATDAVGRVEIGGLRAGTWRLSALRVNHAPTTAAVRAGERAACRFEVDGDQRLHVTVVDADGVPRAGADVWCEDPYRPDEVTRRLGTTDPRGVLEYRGLPVTTVWARLRSLQPSIAHELPAATEPRQAAPRDPIPVRLELGRAGCTLRGIVQQPDGAAAANARVAIVCEDSLRPRRRELLLTSDDAGAFVVDELPPGERWVAADLAPFAPAIVRTATALEQPAVVTLPLTIGTTLTGCVTTAGGAPCSEQTVTASRRRAVTGLTSPWGNARLTRTDGDGRYRLTGIAPGEFEARVEETRTSTALTCAFTGSDGQVIEWNPVHDLDRRITGVLIGPDERPLANWRLAALPPANVRSFAPAEHTSDGAGRFTISGLRDVAYRVFAFAPLATNAERWTAAAAVPRATFDDVRPSSESRTLRVAADAMRDGWLQGHVVWPDGLAKTAQLSLYPHALRGRAGFLVPAQQLAAGTATFRLGPLPPGGYSLLCDVEGRARLHHDDVQVRAGETLQLPPFDFAAQYEQLIVLRHVDGRPATGGAVKLKSLMLPCAETEPGRYRSPPTGLGADVVTFSGPDFVTEEAPCMRTSTTAPIEIVVRAATPVVVRVLPRTPRERWIGALSVKLQDERGGVVVADLLQIDAAVDFRWPIGLAPGTYSLSLVAHGDGKVDTTIVVGTGAQQIDVQLTN